jgi:hypothetical protein
MRRMSWTLSMLVVVMSVTVGRGYDVAGITSTVVAASDAQKPPPPPPAPPADTAPATANRKAPPPPPAAPTPDGRNRKVGPNVKVEVTFSEQRSDGPATPKTVTITTNDGQWGRVRSSVNTATYGVSPLHVDARPEVLADGRVLLSVNIEYGEKRVPTGKEVQPGQVIEVSLNESVTLLLESGKGLAVTQSADPMSDRKVSVEVKATVLKN